MPISKAASSPARTQSRSTSSDAALVHLLDPGRVDPAVAEQLLQAEPGDLAADRVEAAEQHRTRGVVDDQVDPGDLLEGPDVAALPADDPTLHVVAGQRDQGGDALAGLLGGQPLDRGGEHAPGPLLGVLLRGLLDGAGADRGVPLGVGLDALDELGAGLLHTQPGGPLQGGPALVRRRGQLAGPHLQGPGLLVETALPLGQPVLTALDVLALLVQVVEEVVLRGAGCDGSAAAVPRRRGPPARRRRRRPGGPPRRRSRRGHRPDLTAPASSAPVLPGSRG